MNPATGTRAPRRLGPAMAGALLTLAAATAGSMLPSREGPVLVDCLVSAGIAGLGTVLMALILARHAPTPRRGFITAAAVLALLLLLAPFTSGGPGPWRDHVRPLLWLGPWFPLAVLVTGRGRAERAGGGPCAPAPCWGTPVVIAVAVVLGGIVVAIGPVSRLLRGPR